MCGHMVGPLVKCALVALRFSVTGVTGTFVEPFRRAESHFLCSCHYSLVSGDSRARQEPGWFSRQPDDPGQPMALPQGEQSLCLHGPGPDRWRGHGLAPVDPIVVAVRSDLGPLRGERGPHDVGQGAVEMLACP